MRLPQQHQYLLWSWPSCLYFRPKAPILSLQWSSSFNPTDRSAQRQFIDFCTLDGYISSNGSLLPTYEQTLLRFCSRLADRLHHSSIRVYLSAIRSLHIDQGFPDPLVNCLQLKRFLRGIKHHQGSTLPQRQPVTADLMRIIQRSLDTHNSEYLMRWAACCLGFFGFLRAGEFTVNFTFDPSIHLTVQDLQVDADVNPSSLRVCLRVCVLPYRYYPKSQLSLSILSLGFHSTRICDGYIVL